MNNFNRERRDNRRDNRGGSFNGGGNRERPQMHEVICSDCSKRCEVPFKPTNKKPVYCRDCFRKYGEKSSDFSRPNRGTDRFQRNDFESKRNETDQHKELFDKLISKLDIIIGLLSEKKEEKEVKTPKKILKKPVSKKKVNK